VYSIQLFNVFISFHIKHTYLTFYTSQTHISKQFQFHKTRVIWTQHLATSTQAHAFPLAVAVNNWLQLRTLVCHMNSPEQFSVNPLHFGPNWRVYSSCCCHKGHRSMSMSIKYVYSAKSQRSNLRHWRVGERQKRKGEIWDGIEKWQDCLNKSEWIKRRGTSTLMRLPLRMCPLRDRIACWASCSFSMCWQQQQQ